MEARVVIGANKTFGLFPPNSAKATHLSDSKNVIYQA